MVAALTANTLRYRHRGLRHRAAAHEGQLVSSSQRWNSVGVPGGSKVCGVWRTAVPSRRKLSSDDITALDMQEPNLAYSLPPKLSGEVGAGPAKVKETTSQTEVQAGAKVELSAKDKVVLEGLPDLLELTSVERADLIDELTRKAFVLMDAGEVAQAKIHLDRAARIAGAFQQLTSQATGKADGKKEDFKAGNIDEILVQLQRELHNDDFVRIFGNKRFSEFMGGA